MQHFMIIKAWGKKSALAILVGSLFVSVAVADIVVGPSTTNTSTNVAYSQVTLSRPSGTSVGDILVASISINGGAEASTVSAPSGWNLIARTDNDNNISIVSYWKAADSNESNSYTWTIAPQTRATGGVTRYSGIDTSNPIDAVASSTGRGTNAVAPTVATSGPNERLLALFATRVGTNSSPVNSTSTGMTKLYDVKNIPFGPTASAQDSLQALEGASGSKTSVVSNSAPRDWAAQLIALRPSTPGVTFNAYEFVQSEPSSLFA
jgi:hypothetical protein